MRYINKYRQDQGVGELTRLSGLSDVAQYRAKQLATNFAHDEDDIREATAYYQYGEYIDMTEFGGSASQSHYTHRGGEGIGKLGIGGISAAHPTPMLA